MGKITREERHVYNNGDIILENSPHNFMKLWKVHIKTYKFGIYYYDLFVLADTESNMLRKIYAYPSYKNDEDAEIEKYEEINLKDTENRVL